MSPNEALRRHPRLTQVESVAGMVEKGAVKVPVLQQVAGGVVLLLGVAHWQEVFFIVKPPEETRKK